MRRWVTALVALGLGMSVSAALLLFANPDRNAVEVFAAARDLPAGTVLGSDAVVLVRMSSTGLPPLVFRGSEATALAGLRATHDLAAGQLLQRSDAISADATSDRRLVFLPVKDVPPAAAGSRVDLLVIDTTPDPDHLSVSPFALGVEVESAVPGGLVVVVSSRQAPAFVYAAVAMQLTAVIAGAASGAGTEAAVSSAEQALAVAAQP
jgi:hypothetical protein